MTNNTQPIKLRNFNQEYLDALIAHGLTPELFEGTDWTAEKLCTEIKKFLPDMQMSSEVLNLESFERIVNGDITLIEVQRILNRFVFMTPNQLGLSLSEFVGFQKQIKRLIGNYNKIHQPIKDAINEAERRYNVKNNPPGSMKGNKKNK